MESIFNTSFFQVGGVSYKEDGLEEMDSLRNQKSEEDPENFVFEESGNEYYDRPDERKSVTISFSLEEDLTLLCDNSNVQ